MKRKIQTYDQLGGNLERINKLKHISAMAKAFANSATYKYAQKYSSEEKLYTSNRALIAYVDSSTDVIFSRIKDYFPGTGRVLFQFSTREDANKFYSQIPVEMPKVKIWIIDAADLTIGLEFKNNKNYGTVSKSSVPSNFKLR